jgi:hypothetical protein
MHAGSPLYRALALIAVFLAGLVAGQLSPPVWKSLLVALAQQRYQEVTYRCDRAMRGHMIAKQRLFRTPGKATVAELEAAEIGLLDCQDYDILRKRLLSWGLSEYDLSFMALKAIEAGEKDLQKVVETHEIRY